MEVESAVGRSMIDELHSSDIQGDQREGESGVTGSIIDDLHSSDIQVGQLEGEGGVIRRIVDELHASDMVKWKKKVLLLEVSLMNLNLVKSKKINWKVKVV